MAVGCSCLSTYIIIIFYQKTSQSLHFDGGVFREADNIGLTALIYQYLYKILFGYCCLFLFWGHGTLDQSCLVIKLISSLVLCIEKIKILYQFH